MNNKITGKCAIYARVSTEGQNPEIQTKELETYIFNKGIGLYKTYVDKVSGTKDSSPALAIRLKGQSIY